MSDINAAVLQAQLEFSDTIQERRRSAFNLYTSELSSWADRIGATLPHHLLHDDRSFHLFPILMRDLDTRARLLAYARDKNISLTFHYVPLHNSPGGVKYGRFSGNFANTQQISDRLVRLPLFSDITWDETQQVIEDLVEFS